MKAELSIWLDEMAGKTLLVIGDVVADRYVDGRISRISREAPVLVLEEVGEEIVAGGAANVANNGATLGGRIFAAGIIGTDTAGDGLRRVLSESGVDTGAILAVEGRPTISKTRIIAGGRATVSQQIVRLDRESKEAISKVAEQTLLRSCLELMPQVDAVVLSDYGSGTVTEAIRAEIIGTCREYGIPTMVDSRYDVASFHGIDYVKQNDGELAAAVGRTLKTEEDLFEAGQALMQRLEASGVLITRGEKGMMLFEADGAVHDIPVSDKSEVFDVSGAGDTCVAAFMLAIAAGASPPIAAELANIASGIAVRKMGTATVSADELRGALR